MSSHSLVHLVLTLLLLKCTCTLARACNVTGEVRLNDGSINSDKGRLEICARSRGEWGTVCSDGFNINAARVVCRQLGVEGDDLSMVVTNIFFGGGEQTQPIHLNEVRCTGTETSLLNCTHNGIGVIGNCNHYDDVGIICRPSQDCTDGDVRLVDGDNSNVTAGRVEYCVGGLWGTVCSHLWGDVDAAVVCRQLNLNSIDPKTLQNVPQVTNRRTPFVLDGVNCGPDDARLSDCGHAVAVVRCRHEDDAGAFCTNVRVCNDSEVRLIQASGEMENEGRVDFCRSGRWGVICNDNWDNIDAKVVCRQLGYDVENGNAMATERTTLGRDPPPTVLNNVDCDGTETNIAQCTESSSLCLSPGTGVICPVQNDLLVTMATSDSTVASDSSPHTHSPVTMATSDITVASDNTVASDFMPWYSVGVVVAMLTYI